MSTCVYCVCLPIWVVSLSIYLSGMCMHMCMSVYPCAYVCTWVWVWQDVVGEEKYFSLYSPRFKDWGLWIKVMKDRLRGEKTLFISYVCTGVCKLWLKKAARWFRLIYHLRLNIKGWVCSWVGRQVLGRWEEEKYGK